MFERVFLIIALSLLLQQPTFAQDWQTQTSDPHKMFIKFREGARLLKLAREPREEASKPKVQQQASELGSFQAALGIVRLRAVKPDATLERLPGGIERLYVASLADGSDVTQVLEAAHGMNEVEYAEPVYICGGGDVPIQLGEQSQGLGESSFFPNDPQFPNQWGLHNTGQYDFVQNGKVGADLNVLTAWDITTGSSDVLVAFLASGLQTSYRELCTRDAVSRVYKGYNFVSDNNDVTDDNWLGTYVTGVAAATGNNSYVMAGVDWNCLILPVKVVNASFVGSSDWTAFGLTYAADQGANVICMPFGAWNYKAGSALNDALIYAISKGSIIVACAASGWSYFNSYPAASDKIILVGSVDNRDKRLATSYGRVDFMAPGEKIMGLSYASQYGGTYVSGPTAATPLVAGVVSLMLSLKKSLTFQEVYDILKESAVDQVGWPYEDTPGWDPYHGWGRVNAYRALRLILERYRIGNTTYDYGASQNYPNPFNGRTTIEYQLPKYSDSRSFHVSLKVYNILGQPVTTLVDEVQGMGYHYAYWYPSGPSGVYFYRLEAGDFVKTCKMIVVK